MIAKSCSAIFVLKLTFDVFIVAKWKFLLAFCGDWRESTVLSRFNQTGPSLDLTASPVIQWTWPTCITNLHKVLPAQAALASSVPKKKANLKRVSDECTISELATSLITMVRRPFWRTNGSNQGSLHPILPSRKIPSVLPRPLKVWLSFRTRRDNFCSRDSADSTLHSELSEVEPLPRSEQLTTW